jgi:O-antigen ligase
MSPLTMLVLMVAAALLALSAVRWQRGLVMSLPFLAVVNGLAVPLRGVSIRLDQLVACALVVPIAASLLIGRRVLRLDRTSWLLVAILAMNVLASALNSPARRYSLSQCANLASVWIIYVVLLNLLETRDDLEQFFNRMLAAALAASVIGVGAFVLALAGFSVGGAEVSSSAALRLTNAYGAYGTMVEPNILGGFAAVYLVMSIALLAVSVQDTGVVHDRSFVRWVAVSCAVALVLTFTRGAWVGAVVGIAGLAGLHARAAAGRIRLRRIVVPVAAAGVVVGALLVLPGDTGTLFRFKLFNLLNVETQTGVVRVLSYALAAQQTVDHPVVGWGTFTFAPLVAQGPDFQQFDNWRNLWIGNYLLLAVHDTGIIGLALWIALLWNVVARAATGVRRLRQLDPAISGRMLALVLGVVTLLVAFLATSGFSLGYTWVILGLLGAHLRVANDTSAQLVVPDPDPAAARATESFAPLG